MNAVEAMADPPAAVAAGRLALARQESGRTRRFYRAIDVAKALGVTQRTVQRWVRRGQVDGRRAGEILLLDADSVDRRLRGMVGVTGPEIAPAALVSKEPAKPWDRDAVLVVEETPRSADAGRTSAPADALELESVASVAFREVLARIAATDPIVETDSRRLHGSPAIRGTRIPVSLVLHYLAEGRTVRKILADFPGLTRQQVLGAVDYAARLLEQPVD